MTPHLQERYRAETRRLVIKRGPVCAWLFAGGVAIASLIEYGYHPERLGYLLLFVGLEVGACLVTIALYRTRNFRHAGVALMHAACMAILVCVTTYAAVTGSDVTALGFLFIVFALTTALMFPWGVRNQLPLALACVALYGASMLASPTSAHGLLAAHGLYAVVIACVLSLLGAANLDRQRRALFVQRERLDQHLATFRELTRTFHRFDTPRVLILTCGAVLQAFDLRRLWVVWPTDGVGTHGYALGPRHGRLDWTPLADAGPLWGWARAHANGGHAFLAPATDAPPLGVGEPRGPGKTLCIPVQSDGTCRAYIYGDRGEERLALGERDLALASVVAGGTAIALANAALYAQVRRTSSEKSVALARIAHELRNPLQAILWDLDSLLQDATGDDRRLGQMHDHARMTLEMARELQDFAEVETRRVDVSPETINLAETCDNLRVMALPLLDGRPITFEIDVAADAAMLRTDPFRLRQILGNLIANAAKFTERGTITLATERRGPEIAIHVRDTGIGIAAAERDRIFTPFYRASGTRVRGMGLGLAIVQELTEVLGGRIEVAGALGVGSTLSVLLPAATGAADGAATRDTAPSTQLALDSRPAGQP